MFGATLFHIGPYAVCLWNVLIWAVVITISIFFQRKIQQSLKTYLHNANISVEGRRVTLLRFLSQSVYILAVYIAVLSFNINNANVTFSDFLNFKLIDSDKFSLSFYHILLVVSIFFGASILLNFVRFYINRRNRNEPHFNKATAFVYVQIAKYVIYVFAIIFSLKALEVDLTVLLTGSAALLVGIGLGLQDVFKDIFSGLVLLIEGNVRVGDVVEISSSTKGQGFVAKILKINIRTTQIETREGNVMIIPNARLTQEYIENWSHGSRLSRFRILLSVNYGADVELVEKLLHQAALTHPNVKKGEGIEVRLVSFGSSGLEMELLFWADQSWDVEICKSDIRKSIDQLFRQHQITIPYPQTVMHVKHD
jgi:small-conductance mechanosensitive channel